MDTSDIINLAVSTAVIFAVKEILAFLVRNSKSAALAVHKISADFLRRNWHRISALFDACVTVIGIWIMFRYVGQDTVPATQGFTAFMALTCFFTILSIRNIQRTFSKIREAQDINQPLVDVYKILANHTASISRLTDGQEKLAAISRNSLEMIAAGRTVPLPPSSAHSTQ